MSLEAEMPIEVLMDPRHLCDCGTQKEKMANAQIISKTLKIQIMK